MANFSEEEKRMRRISQGLTVFNLIQVFVLIILLSIGVIAWSLVNIFRADQVTRDMRRESHELMDIEMLEVTFIREFLAEKNYILTGDEKYITEFEGYKAQTAEFLNDARNYSAAGWEKVALDNLAEETQSYNDNFDQIVEQYRAGNREEAIRLSTEVSNKKLERVNEQVEDMVFHGETVLQSEVEEVDREIRTSIFTGVFGLILFPVLAVWAFVISTRMTMPFLTLTNAASAIAGNRFRPELLGNLTERQDGLGLLARSLEKTAYQMQARHSTMQLEVEQLADQLQDTKARRLVSSIPGRHSLTHISEN
jgi:methyl-accepting chemotaxis protein